MLDSNLKCRLESTCGETKQERMHILVWTVDSQLLIAYVAAREREWSESKCVNFWTSLKGNYETETFAFLCLHMHWFLLVPHLTTHLYFRHLVKFLLKYWIGIIMYLLQRTQSQMLILLLLLVGFLGHKIPRHIHFPQIVLNKKFSHHIKYYKWFCYNMFFCVII